LLIAKKIVQKIQSYAIMHLSMFSDTMEVEFHATV
jgi:hypothetical protein